MPAIRERLRLVAGVISQALARQGNQTALDEALQEIRHLHDRLADGRERGADDGHRDAARGEDPALVASGRLGEPDDQALAGAGRTGRADAGHCPAARRDRRRQGSVCAGDPRSQPAAQPPHGSGQLRGDSARAHRERVVRPRARRLHRRAVAADRTLRGRQPVDALPRRDRRAAAGSAGEAAARAAGTGDRAAGQHAAAQDRRPDHRRHQPQPRTGGRPTARSARISSTASTCSRSSCRRCASASRTSPGWCGRSSTSSRALFGKRIESVSKDSLRDLQGYSWPGNVRELRNVIERAVILATGPHLVVQAPKPSVARRGRPPRRSRRWKSATSAACSRAPTGGCAGAAAPPNVSASSRPRSRAGWRGSGITRKKAS